MLDHHEDAQRSDAGSGSTSPNSTSTYEYSHEPYDTFQGKVPLLAKSVSGCDEVILQRQKGSSYNRTEIANLTKGKEIVHRILRTPRFSSVTDPGEEGDEAKVGASRVDDEILDQAAVLQLLATRWMSAPSLLAFDATAVERHWDALHTPGTL